MATRSEPLTITQTRGRSDPFIRALSSVDHQIIGVRTMTTAFLFFCLGGLLALFMRAQLAVPENTLLSPDVYNQFFTMHGATMVFFFTTPFLFGLGSFLIPLMIGARDMAFPRLNAFGYWVFLFSGLFMEAGFIAGAAPNGGWIADNLPLTGPQYSTGLNLVFWSLGLIFLSVSIFTGAVNFIVTILKRRAPGMPANSLPLFAWSMLMAAVVAIFAALLLAASNIWLMLERVFQNFAHIDPLAWQHITWALALAVLGVILLPAVGIASEVIAAFTRRPVMGERLLRASIVAVGVIGIILVVAYLATAGSSLASSTLHNLVDVILAVPLGFLIFAWMGTLLAGRPVWRSPLMWIGGAIFLFVVGGISGVMYLIAPFDRQVATSFYFVAFLHYLAIGGAIFPMLAGFAYWFPRFSGRLLNERLSQVSFWLFFIGFNIAFFCMYLLGLEGMPRRIYTYRPGMGWDTLNLMATMGGLMIAESALILLVNVILSLSRGESAGDNPWDASTPEWTAQAASRMGKEATEARLVPGSLIPFWLAVALLVIFLGLLLSLYWLAGVGLLLTIIAVLLWIGSSRARRVSV